MIHKNPSNINEMGNRVKHSQMQQGACPEDDLLLHYYLHIAYSVPKGCKCTEKAIYSVVLESILNCIRLSKSMFGIILGYLLI